MQLALSIMYYSPFIAQNVLCICTTTKTAEKIQLMLETTTVLKQQEIFRFYMSIFLENIQMA